MAEEEVQPDDVTSLINGLAPSEAAPATETTETAAEVAEDAPVIAEDAVQAASEPEPEAIPEPAKEPEAAAARVADAAPTKPEPAKSADVTDLEKKQADIETEIDAVEAKLESRELDEFSAAPKLTILTNRLSRIIQKKAEARAAAIAVSSAIDDQWAEWGAKNKDIGTDRGRKMLAEEFDKAFKEFPDASQQTLHALALRDWNKRINAVRAQKKAPEPAGRKPPVTPGGGKSLPPVNQRSAPPQAKTIEEQVREFGARAGSPELLLS